jgi:hypothetical protein
MAQSHIPSVLSAEEAEALGLGNPTPTFSDKVRDFFDPGYIEKRNPTLLDFGKQAAKAGALLTGGSTYGLLGGGALAGAGLSDKKDPIGLAWDATKSAATTLVGGKALQKGIEATLWPNQLVPQLAKTAAQALDPRRPIIRLTAMPAAAAGGAAAATAVPAQAPTVVTTTEGAIGPVVKRLTGGPITPTQSAQLLSSHGVRMTRGQQDPLSTASQLENAYRAKIGKGSEITAQRAVGPEDLRIAALNIGRPPGMEKIQMDTPFEAAMGDVVSGFRRAYGEVGDFPVFPAVHGQGAGPLQGTANTPGLAEQAAGSVKRLTPSQRASVLDDVNDLLGKLPPRRGAIGQVSSADLMDLRSTVRARARDYHGAHTPESAPVAEAYDAVDDAITAALESQLPIAAAQRLKETDKAYRQFKTVERAVQAGRASPDGFTARQLAMAASHGASGAQIGSGQLGPLYDLGIAGADVFRSAYPLNGSVLATLADAGAFPVVGKWVNAVKDAAKSSAVAAANRQAMSAVPAKVRLLSGPTYGGTQVSLPRPIAGGAAVDPMVQALVDAMARSGRIRLGFPVAADEETPTR